MGTEIRMTKSAWASHQRDLIEGITFGFDLPEECEVEKGDGENGPGRSTFEWGRLWSKSFRQHERTL